MAVWRTLSTETPFWKFSTSTRGRISVMTVRWLTSQGSEFAPCDVAGHALGPHPVAVGSLAQSSSVTASMTRVQPPATAAIAGIASKATTERADITGGTGLPVDVRAAGGLGDGDAEVLDLEPDAAAPDLEAREHVGQAPPARSGTCPSRAVAA